MHEKIAKITDTFLGREDHGVLTATITVTYGNSSFQGIGGYTLDGYDRETKERTYTGYGLEFIARILEVCNVQSWEKLKGRTIFVLMENEKYGARVLGIKSLPTEGNASFIFDDLADKYKE